MSKKKITSKEWATEFQAFMSAEAVEPPSALSSEIVAKVHADLHPPVASVFSKMAAIHFVVGTLMLFICPQFGIALFDGMGLMSLFMHYGEMVCSVACGAVFLGSSAFTASLLLRPEEINVIRRTKFLQLWILAMLSIGVFISLGATIVMTLGIAWVIGSVIGGFTTLELGWLIRSQFRRRIVHGI